MFHSLYLVLIKQLQDNAKLKILDELILFKMEELLTSLSISIIDQEQYLSYCFEIYNTSLIFAKYLNSSKKSAVCNKYIARLRQISCEIIIICVNAENNYELSSNSLEEGSKSKGFFLSSSNEIFFDLLKILIRTCILLLDDLNQNIEIIFKDLSQARAIYVDYLVLPYGSEVEFITKFKKNSDKVQIIGLFYLLDLEVSLELMEHISFKNLVQSFKRVFELYEVTEGNLLDLQELIKLMNIYVKTIIKGLGKNDNEILKDIFEICRENQEFRKCFNPLKTEKIYQVFLKLFILFHIDKEYINSELLEQIIEEVSIENKREKDLFILNLQTRKMIKENIFSGEIKASVLKTVKQLLIFSDPMIIKGILSIVELFGKENTAFQLELLKLIMLKAETLCDESFQELLVYLVKFTEERHEYSANLMEIFEFLLKALDQRSFFIQNDQYFDEKNKGTDESFINEKHDVNSFKNKFPSKIQTYLFQNLLRFAIFYSCHDNYNFSQQILKKLIEFISKEKSPLYIELLYYHLNNQVMARSKERSKITYETIQKHENMNLVKKNFFTLLINYKYNILQNHFNKSSSSSNANLKELFSCRDFNLEIFLCEILCFDHTASEIRLILEQILDFFYKNNQNKYDSDTNLYPFIEKGNCLAKFLQPIIKDFILIGNETKENINKNFSQENVKILISLGNFFEDSLKTVFEGKCDLNFFFDEEQLAFFDALFWNIMIITGRLGLDIILSRKIIYLACLMKILRCRNWGSIKIENLDELPIQVYLLKILVKDIHQKEELNHLRIQELVQILLLLVINYVATSKIPEKKGKIKIEIQLAIEIAELSLEIVGFLGELFEEMGEKLEKMKLLLETHKFELYLLSNSGECSFLLENNENKEADPIIWVCYSHLAKQYNQKNLSTQALRKYLKACFDNGDGSGENQSFLTISAYREVLQEIDDESEYLHILKQIWIFCDNQQKNLPKDEIFFIVLFSIKKMMGFSEKSKNEVKAVINLFWEKKYFSSEEMEKLLCFMS